MASGMPYMYVWICVCINIYVHFWFPFSVLGFWRACVRAWLGCYAPCLSHLLVCLLVLVCFVPGLGGIHANICGSVPATVVCTCTCASVHPCFGPFRCQLGAPTSPVTASVSGVFLGPGPHFKKLSFEHSELHLGVSMCPFWPFQVPTWSPDRPSHGFC